MVRAQILNKETGEEIEGGYYFSWVDLEAVASEIRKTVAIKIVILEC